MLSRRQSGKPGRGSQAAQCDAPWVNPQPFFITPSSGSGSISGFTRAGLNVSVFFRDDRVIAKAVGRHVPADLFQVGLPSPPQAESEDPMQEPRVGMTAHEVRDLVGALSFRVDYVVNGQPAYEGRGAETFVAFTFVDGVTTEFENLGRMPGDVSFQGR
jgi:hypothetical protein